ncbi:putative coenzyme Q-binding protein [Cavenderia fasciculata]|uniref:Coenzyme Q-binding protein n=1 Tax=Cavenderia fasciculata TaxID=261658 RepID=F4Q0W2_CACFS|nr:putative coenzyme Q-binding protein [Cavenderia fasciculata]EGG18463.1 putative coenzyme Q-binding protein [Cavenderia fasciculata]|eukprot:XP_004366367.1 putative coenzyme Q-binding protein [Cavenderia fasciculata]
MIKSLSSKWMLISTAARQQTTTSSLASCKKRCISSFSYNTNNNKNNSYINTTTTTNLNYRNTTLNINNIILSTTPLQSTTVSSSSNYQQKRNIFGVFTQTPDQVHKSLSKTLKYTPEQVYNVVSKVQEYRDFLPFCIDSRITKIVTPGKCFEAILTVGAGAVNESYTSKVTLDHLTYINASSIDSTIFHNLSFTWRFKTGPSTDTCTVDCQLDYQFKSSLHSTMMDQFFANSLESMITAFDKRCDQLYHNNNKGRR